MSASIRISLLLCCWLSMATPAAADEKTAAPGDVFPFKVHKTLLDNGLKVMAIPFDSPGTVAHYIVVRTGSRDEVEPGHSGFAHFFEHMMFRGTERFSVEAYNDVLKRMGAESNAFTHEDKTIFHIIGPASALETMLDLEADRFKKLKYDEDAFRTEAQAVLGEYNRSASNPVQALFERMLDITFTKHTYKHTVIGFLEDVKAMPGYYDYSLKFFDRFYRPENTTLLVVGDVQPQQLFSLAKKHFGDWKKGYKPADVPVEPPQTEQRTGRVDWPNPTSPYLMLAYHIPPATSPDYAALELVEQLLFSESAPLFQELVVKNQWVDFIQGSPNPERDPGLFVVLARVRSEDLVPKVKEVVERHIQGLQTQPIDARHLDRIKSHLRYAFALGLDTPGEIAERAAQAIALTGDVDVINQRFAQYQKVTLEDIRRVARDSLRIQNETMVILAHKADAAAGEGNPGGASQ